MSVDAQKLHEARTLYETKRAPEALALTEELLTADPDNPDILINLSLYLRAVGKFEESLDALTKVPESTPGYAMLMGWHKLRQGKFLKGQRVREPELGINRIDKRLPFPQEKRVQKDTDISGKKILFALEGGVGDEIAYVRFVQTLKKLGARVSVACSPEVIHIVERASGVDEVWPLGAVSHDQYDYYLPSMSAVSLFDIEDPTRDIEFPYLSPSEAHVQKWQPVLKNAAHGQLKIGIQWQGNAQFEHVEFKSIPAHLFAPFAELGTLVSLQRPETIGANKFPADTPLFETQTGTPNWEDTLAVISEMDYIIAGDTTITHMAGALGKPTLLLVPHAPHPYWADLKEQSTWYPRVRVCRQPAYNDWEGAARVAYEYFRNKIEF